MRERESNVIRKNCIFFTLFYITKVAPSVRSPLERKRSSKLIQHLHAEYPLKHRRVQLEIFDDTEDKNNNGLVRGRRRERERERGTFHSRAFFSFKTRRSFLLYTSLVLKIGTLLASLPFLIKNPPRRTQVTQRRKNASTNTHIFKTRMAKYYPDIAKGAKGTRFQTRFIILFCTVFCSLFCANKSAISHPPPERISTWCLTVLSLIIFF